MNHFNEFAHDVAEGLISKAKYLDSKYLYDENGSALFQSIMNMPEYYPTDSEFEILSEKQQKFASHLDSNMPVEFIELGAGDGMKVISFLKYFLNTKQDCTYTPVDISNSALINLKARVQKAIPALNINTIHDDYFNALKELSRKDNVQHVYLFLGGNIGNFPHADAINFLKKIRRNIHKNDLLIIGFDLIKDPRIILKAYDDPYGITASFNLNILKRINRELQGNFDLTAFKYYPYYHPGKGEVRSYIYSLKKQNVRIERINATIPFEQWEHIHTEVSRKFDLSMIEQLAKETGFSSIEHIFDCKHYFADSIFKAI